MSIRIPHLLLLASASLLLSFAPASSTQDPKPAPPTVKSTQEVADSYFKLCYETERKGSWAKSMGELLAADVYFVDRTTEVYGMPLANGIKGREAVVKEMISFNLKDHGLAVETSFVCGEYALWYGEFSYTAALGDGSGKTIPTHFKLTSVVRIEKGLVTERYDSGDYWDLTRQIAKHSTKVDASSLDEAEAKLRKTVDAYFIAYGKCEFDVLESLWAKDVSFQDPTGALFGAGKLTKGNSAVSKNLQSELKVISTHGGMRIQTKDSFITGRHAIYLQRVAWPTLAKDLGLPDTPPGKTYELSADVLMVLEIEDGKVLSHRDYVSYHEVRDQIQAYANALTASDK